MTNSGKFCVGFYRGGADLSHGGVSPYSERLAKILVEYEFSSEIAFKILSASDLASDSKISFLKSVIHRVGDSFQVLVKPGVASCRIRPREAELPSGLRNIDLLHVPFQVPPIYEIPYVCTMHDVQELHFPEYFTASERERRAIHFRRSIENAVHIVVSFEHVRQDIIKFFGRSEGDVSVLPLPIHHCQIPEATASDAAIFRSKYGRLGKYFLYPAQTWKHKNHKRLIDAFEKCCQQVDSNLHLVCTGAKNDHFVEIEEHIEASSVADRVHFLGLVDEGELGWLYRNSLAVVIPTLYEAGSFPLIEALLLQVPVICSCVTSLPETIGDTRFIFDPHQSASIFEAMQKLLLDAQYLHDCRQNSIQRREFILSVQTARSYEEFWIRLYESGSVGR